MIANAIAAAILAKTPPADIRAEVPDIVAAYEIQDAVFAKLGAEIGGYKIAWNNGGAQPPAVGCILRDHIWKSGMQFPKGAFAQLVVEPEIIAVIGTDIIGAGHTAETIRGKISHFHTGFEIMDRRNVGAEVSGHPPSIIANNIFNNGLVFGKTAVENLDIAGMETILHRNGDEVFRKISAAPQDTYAAVAQVANTLATRGKTLKVGDYILCGTHFPPFDLPVGGALQVSMGTLGDASFTYG